MIKYHQDNGPKANHFPKLLPIYEWRGRAGIGGKPGCKRRCFSWKKMWIYLLHLCLWIYSVITCIFHWLGHLSYWLFPFTLPVNEQSLLSCYFFVPKVLFFACHESVLPFILPLVVEWRQSLVCLWFRSFQRGSTVLGWKYLKGELWLWSSCRQLPRLNFRIRASALDVYLWGSCPTPATFSFCTQWAAPRDVIWSLREFGLLCDQSWIIVAHQLPS